MPVLPTDDQLDPLEQADLDDAMDQEEEDDAHLHDADSAAPAPELDPEIVEELAKVMVADNDLIDDGTSIKAKGHMIPERLISQPLRPEDLWDEDGTI